LTLISTTAALRALTGSVLLVLKRLVLKLEFRTGITLFRVKKVIVVIETLGKPVLGMSRTTLLFRFAENESSKVLLLRRIAAVLKVNVPTILSERSSIEPSKSELALLFSFAFRTVQDSLESSPIMTSTV